MSPHLNNGILVRREVGEAMAMAVAVAVAEAEAEDNNGERPVSSLRTSRCWPFLFGLGPSLGMNPTRGAS